ncbi:Pr6Pr family membrane protein [Paramicrobacterium agarici]|uniref:FAR-17a/AIG1-like protein n=1 Tax=Paramicrobacterium agarici TaxID=630514 RepID=A0A2A9DR50_9MICO|nr:Pr6Pr family membrane protein [Microbacterium agarici]PFG29168.1 hypothetical protein ATJ78_0064 [Microbacterium agarici]
MRTREGAVRAAIALPIVLALGYELVRTAGLLEVSVLENLIDYVSYFTTLSNVVAAATLGVGAVIAVRAEEDPEWYGQLVVASIAYTMTTFAVYNISLRPVSTAPDSWANEVLHVAGPLSMAVWWAVSPHRRTVRWRSILTVLAVPSVWLGYTMVRGELVGWYPYDFLDPRNAGGLAAVVGYVLVAVGIICACAVLAVAVSRPRPSWFVAVQRHGRQQLISARRALGTEHLAPAGRAQQQSRRRTDAVGLGLRLVGDDVPFGRGDSGHEPLNIGHGPPRGRTRSAERRRVQHNVHSRVNARRGAPVPARSPSR